MGVFLGGLNSLPAVEYLIQPFTAKGLSIHASILEGFGDTEQ